MRAVKALLVPLLISVLAVAIPAAVRAEEQSKLDWNVWEQMPVFDNGRMMPVVTFARSMVERISGRANPRLSLEGASGPDESQPPGLEATRQVFSGDKRRQFTASELLFGWLAEPQRWENVPFLAAVNEELRKEVLGLPVLDSQGQRLKYASPWQVSNSDGLQKMLLEIRQKQAEAAQQGQRAELTTVEDKARELFEAYALYRRVTFNPAPRDAQRDRTMDKLVAAIQTWRKLEPDLKQMAAFGVKDTEKLLKEAGKVEEILALSQRSDVPIEQIEPQIVAYCRATSQLAREFAAQKERLFRAPPPGVAPQQLKQVRTRVHALASGTADLARIANEAHQALYDNGYTLRLVPALNPAALEKNRDANDDAQPWLSIQALLAGSDEVLRGYPRDSVAKVRQAFSRAAEVYTNRGTPDRAQQFSAALASLDGAVRRLGEQLEPIRNKLPFRQRDNDLIAATAYPPVGDTHAEVLYYRVDPFFWSWLVSSMAMACFGLAFGMMRKPMFALGLFVLLVAQALTVYGLGLRVYITGWAPVTNMFETVIFVALVVGLLGLWFTVIPLIWPGLSSAWRATAVPFTPEASPLSDEQQALASPGKWNLAGFALLPPRIALAAAIFWLLVLTPYGSDGGYTVVKLWPRVDVGSSVPTIGNVIVWLVGLSMLGLGIWLVPRAILTGLLSMATLPYALAKQGLRKPVDQVLARKPFALVGAGVAFLAALVAYYAPVSGKNISLLMPVLRDNFWLTMHVLTITASYGAGALAWGLGNIALGYYLFGRYRDPGEVRVEEIAEEHQPAGDDQPSAEALARRPPEVCAALGTFIYKATQVAVLLLAAGTILGGLWADVSWGRFWGWDSKEVWALISLLIYLAILHGRYAGMFGNFGLAVGSVFGATAILVAWYGVNFVLGSGLHSYGEGSGGKLWVFTILGINWIYVAAAALRYQFETSLPLPAPGAPGGSSEKGKPTVEV
jgi:ABC-type transport system involved in cytochrome c biogenesis permease subunit